MDYEYVKIDSNNIKNYTSIWADVLQIIGRGKSFDHALELINQNEAIFIDAEEMYKTTNKRTDFHYYIRVLKLDGKPIAFINGVVRYFPDAVFFQVGTFGVIKRFQNKGHGTAFWQYIEKELNDKNINYAWGIMKNEGFWEKIGFVSDQKHFLNNYFNHLQPYKTRYKTISTKNNSFEAFMNMFNEEYQVEKTDELVFLSPPKAN